MRDRTAIAAVAALTALTSSTVALAPAQADTSCINTDLASNRRSVALTNTCNDALRVKVFWNRATDTACTTLAPGHALTSSRSFPADFSHWEYC